MRVMGLRFLSVALAGVLLSGAPALGNSAQPSAQPSIPGTKVCTVSDRNAVEISGLALSNGTLYAVNDSTSADARRKVFKLNPQTCAVVGTPLSYPARPSDPEDLAVDAEGGVWIADTGDNDGVRTTVALWKIANDKITGPFRLSYPDGKKYDAEAMVMGADGLPVIITKTEALVFVPTGPLQEGSTAGVPMKQVGKVTLPKTTTDHQLGAVGRAAITGAATSSDRAKVVIRTYTDAFEFPVAGGDIVKALTTGKPKVTALPQEPWGEAITYSADGKFLTMSEVADQGSNAKPDLLSYTPNAEDPNPPSPAAAAAPPAGPGKPWWSSLLSSTTSLYMLIGSVGVFGLLLVIAGIIGIKRSRNRRRKEVEDDDGYDEPMGRRGDEYYEPGPGYGYQDPAFGYGDQPPPAPPRGNTYGNAQPQGGGNVYGGPQGGGNVYGGPQGGGNVYGSPQGGGNVYGGPQGGGNVYGSPQGGGNVYGSPQPPYPPDQQYGQQDGYGYGYPDQGGHPPTNNNYGYQDQGYGPYR